MSILIEASEPDLRRLFKSDSDSWLVSKSTWGSGTLVESRFRSIENRRERKLNLKNISLPIPKVHPDENTSQYSVFSPNDILSAADTISPSPKDSYSPSTPTINQKGFKNYKLIEELYLSERSYISLLQLLQNYYLGPLLDSCKFACGVPLYVMSENVESLIFDHEQFVKNLSVQIERYDKEDVFEMNRAICELLESLVENHYRYIEYCDVYEDALALSKLHTDGMNKPWVGGWSHYLEATQPPSRKLDLSFMSLVQKPTARYGKYRLFLEALLHTTFKDFNQVDENLSAALNKVKSKLELIDFDSSILKKMDESDLLGDMIGFNDSGFTRQFFGKSILVGSLVVAWIELDRVKVATMAVIAFKSHLVLCDVTRGNKRYPILFIIPLAKCIIVDDNKDFDGGLYASYPYSIKILFEIGKAQYEILLAAISKQEFQIWKNTLKTLINVVNGPYNLDFSLSDKGINLIQRVPPKTSPFNVSLTGVNKISGNCYFQRPITIMIYNSIYNATNPGLIAEYCNLDRLEDFDESFELTRYDRIKAEKKMSLIWSPEIPKIMYDKNPKLSRHISLLNFHSFRSQNVSQVELSPEPSPPAKTPIVPLLQFSFKKSSIPIENEEMFTAKTHNTLNRAETLDPKVSTTTIERDKGKISRVSSFRSEIFNLFRSKSKIHLEDSEVKPSNSTKSLKSSKSLRFLFRNNG